MGRRHATFRIPLLARALPGLPSRRVRLGLAALVSLVSAAGVCAAPASAAAPSHNPFGYLDSASFIDGGVSLVGWTIDPDTTRSINVTVTVDGAHAAVVAANVRRPGVAHSYPRYGAAHGYNIRLALANGNHRVCVIANNVGPGSSTTLGCKVVNGQNSPVGGLATATREPGILRVSGWALDPNTTGPIQTRISVDGKVAATVTAADTTAAVPAKYADYGQLHGVDTTIPSPTVAGSHNVCLTAVNVALGADVTVGCARVLVSVNPTGKLTTVKRSAAGAISVSGWALDPDTATPVTVEVTANGALVGTITANQALTAPPIGWNSWGTQHAFSATLTVPAAELTACVSVVNIGAGTDQSLGCSYIPTLGATVPPAPRSLAATVTTNSATLTWAAPVSDGGAAILGYRVTSPGLRTLTLPATATSASYPGLASAHAYSFTVSATNMLGVGTSATVAATTKTVIPLQVTAAPVSTSHYPRNWTSNVAATDSLTRHMGAVDASYNPSGHRYLVLMDLGGQTSGGIMLSATSKFVSYASAVSALDSYLDGYVSTQRQYAPMTLAIGTNNDMYVNSAAGAIWARSLVGPVRQYAARYPNITVVGANDMEPGFSASAAETRAWLSGYLGATTAPFVFNGSADGCSTTVAGSRCNNGWTEADLQWLAGGAAPTRISVLPQIYNTAMPWQWRNISLTGLSAHKPQLKFGGPLTEWTACSQARCSSLSNVVAWQQLWTALNSRAATRQPEMPFGTDLQIN